MEKITYIAAIESAITCMKSCNVEDAYIEKMAALKESVIKRNQKSNKETPKQAAKREADATLVENVREVLMNADKPLTVTEIQQSSEHFAELKVQKVSALVRVLLNAGEVKRDIAKGKAVFSLA